MEDNEGDGDAGRPGSVLSAWRSGARQPCWWTRWQGWRWPVDAAVLGGALRCVQVWVRERAKEVESIGERKRIQGMRGDSRDVQSVEGARR